MGHLDVGWAVFPLKLNFYIDPPTAHLNLINSAISAHCIELEIRWAVIIISDLSGLHTETAHPTVFLNIYVLT